MLGCEDGRVADELTQPTGDARPIRPAAPVADCARDRMSGHSGTEGQPARQVAGAASGAAPAASALRAFPQRWFVEMGRGVREDWYSRASSRAACRRSLCRRRRSRTCQFGSWSVIDCSPRRRGSSTRGGTMSACTSRSPWSRCVDALAFYAQIRHRQAREHRRDRQETVHAPQQSNGSPHPNRARSRPDAVAADHRSCLSQAITS